MKVIKLRINASTTLSVTSLKLNFFHKIVSLSEVEDLVKKHFVM